MESADHVGKLIGKYRLLSVLGEGGMGAVYLAEHQTIGRRAAVKVLQPQLAAQPELVERFLNEARATNRIRHPSIVDIYDCDRHPELGVYLVMELLEGHSLERHCTPETRLEVADAVDILTQVATALAAAHRCDIVHRDLKPANIFVVPAPDHPRGRRAKVLDFGIAKLLTGSSGVQTRTGSLIGTPAYMSPEQCHGARDVDHRTDVYALGVIAYECLAGRPPFVADGHGQLIAMHLNTPPPPLRQFCPQIPSALANAVHQALEKDPGERFGSMDALATALNQALGTAPSIPPTQVPGEAALQDTTPAPTPAPDVPRPAAPADTTAGPGQAPVTPPARRRARGWVAGILVLAALLAGGIGYGVYHHLSSEPAARGGAAEATGGLARADGAPAGQDAAPRRSAEAVTGSSRGLPKSCAPGDWQGPPAAALSLRRVGGKRGRDLIVGFDLDDVVSGPGTPGTGGLGRQNRLAWSLRGCSDSPDRRFARPGTSVVDPHTGLRVTITAVTPAGRSGRGWHGVSCSYRIADATDPGQYVELGGGAVPAHNALSAMLRRGSMVFAALQFNGYAREVKGRGNLVLGLDLCQHRVVWRSADMTSNGQLLMVGDHLITSYGFTDEPDAINVLDRRSGKRVSRARLPKSAMRLFLQQDRLFARIYDGYLVFRLQTRGPPRP